MTVVQILYSGLGGHSSVGFSLVEADQEREYDHIIIFYGIEDMPKASIDKCKELGIRFFLVKKKQGIDIRSYRKVIAILENIKPQIILLHSVNLIVPVFYFGLRKKTRIIAVEHQPNHQKTKLEWVWSFLLMRLSPRVVFLTDLYGSQMRQRLGVFYNGKKVSVINNGININLFKPLAGHRKPGNTGVKIGMLARLTGLKDHKTLLKSFELLLHNNDTGKQFQLHIAGDGDLRDHLVQLTREAGIHEHVIFHGTIGELDSVNFLNELDIYVHASLGETMSTSIMQAMACRKPVIASNVMGINNMITDKVTGILVPAQNAAALADAISNLANNPAQADALAKNAFEFAVANYSNKKMLENYKALFTN